MDVTGFDASRGYKMCFIKKNYYTYDFETWGDLMDRLNADREAFQTLAKNLSFELRVHSNDILSEYNSSYSNNKMRKLIGKNLFFNYPEEYAEFFLDENLLQILT